MIILFSKKKYNYGGDTKSPNRVKEHLSCASKIKGSPQVKQTRLRFTFQGDLSESTFSMSDRRVSSSKDKK